MRRLAPRPTVLTRRSVVGAGLAAAFAPQFAFAASDPVMSELGTLVDRGTLSGAVWAVRQHGRTVSTGAIGFADIAARKLMTYRTIFQIMSTSKVVIALAVQMLAQRGAIDIEAPVSRYLPEFGSQWLIRQDRDGVRTLVRPSRPSSVADLLAHCSGLPDAPPVVGKFALKLRYSLAEMAAIVSQQPLLSEPGAHYHYSNVGIAVAARVVEAVSGMPYEAFVQGEQLAPLGLHRMGFHVSRREESRVPLAYRFDGRLVPLTDAGPGDGDHRFRRGARYILPEAGLYATADELATLFQAVLDDLTDGKARLLSKAALAETLRPSIAIADKDGVVRTRQGLGWRIAAVDGGASDSPIGGIGSFGHSGALGSTAWIDPTARRVAVLMSQTLPAEDIRRAFARGVSRLPR